MDNITKPSITRLARKAGVKSMADECHASVRQLADDYLTDIISAALVVNNTKTLMPENIFDALRLKGYNVAQSSELGTSACAK